MSGNFFDKGPKARATGTATTLPSWIYLIKFETQRKRGYKYPKREKEFGNITTTQWRSHV